MDWNFKACTLFVDIVYRSLVLLGMTQWPYSVIYEPLAEVKYSTFAVYEVYIKLTAF